MKHSRGRLTNPNFLKISQSNEVETVVTAAFNLFGIQLNKLELCHHSCSLECLKFDQLVGIMSDNHYSYCSASENQVNQLKLFHCHSSQYIRIIYHCSQR